MKTLLLILILGFTQDTQAPIYVGGKEVKTTMIEVTLLDQGMYGKYCIVDYGQKITYAGKASKKNLLTDQHGKKIKLKTTIQIINYFTERGWKLMDKDMESSSQSDPTFGGSYNTTEKTFLFRKQEE